MPGWLRTSLVIAAVVGGALLLWIGFAVLVAILLIAALPFWLWSLVKRRRAPQGPVTLEGAATRVDEPAATVAPLTEEERTLLGATPVWVVWYEDQFHVGAERDSFGVGVCFSEEEAKGFIVRSGGKMLTPGYDGHEILGPENPLTTSLFGAQRAEIIRELLDRLARGSREPVPIRI